MKKYIFLIFCIITLLSISGCVMVNTSTYFNSEALEFDSYTCSIGEREHVGGVTVAPISMPETLYIHEYEIPQGAGTIDDPFLIETPQHLAWDGLRSLGGPTIRSRSGYFLLVNDIVAPPNLIISLSEGSVFDGGGHTITVDIDILQDAALFRQIGTQATVRNLTVAGRVRGRGTVGGVTVRNLGRIYNVAVIADIYGGGAGGIVGWNSESGIIANSYTTGNVTGSFHVGGLVGRNIGGTVANSYSISNVIATRRCGWHCCVGVGGLVGGSGNRARIFHSVALNPNITVLDGTLAYRISSSMRFIAMTTGGEQDRSGFTGVNNFASVDMLLNEELANIRVRDNQHGEDVAIDVIHTITFWRDILGWDFNHIWEWNYETDLPVLRNFHREQNHTLFAP